MPRFTLPKLNTYLGHPFRLTIGTAHVFFFIHCLYNYGYSHATPQGPSMLPSHSIYGEGLIIDKTHRYGRKIRVGDAVAYRIPTDPDAEAIKRVLGMPGDYVLVDAPERGRASEGRKDGAEGPMMIQVPEGHCWLVGDNLPVSRDSRMYGPVPLGLIRGKVIAQWVPLSERRWIRNPLDEDAARRRREEEEDVD